MPPEDHDRIDELLAGYALRSVSGPDARELDRLLLDHVPGCPLCRETLAGFQVVAADLGLDARPVEPPDPLLARLRRGIAEAPQGSRRRTASLLAVAASLAALLAMSGLAVTLGRRADEAASQRDLVTSALAQMPSGVSPLALRDEGAERRGGLVGIPNVERFVLVGQEVPSPAPGNVYRVWVGRDGSFAPVADFLPDDGVVILELSVDRSRFDELLITEEPGSPPGPAPEGVRRWWAGLS